MLSYSPIRLLRVRGGNKGSGSGNKSGDNNNEDGSSSDSGEDGFLRICGIVIIIYISL
jgi:hypothetical protein